MDKIQHIFNEHKGNSKTEKIQPQEFEIDFIKNYKDFEFTNSIAYEMAIRTDEFQKVKYLYMVIEDIQNYNLCFYDEASDTEYILIVDGYMLLQWFGSKEIAKIKENTIKEELLKIQI